MSLNGHSIEIKDQHNVEISKQGLDMRYTSEASQFLKAMLQKLCFSTQESMEDGWFEYFNTIRIKDSTKFVLPEAFSDKMVGFGGVSSKSASCIQYEYDLKSGSILDLNLTSANRTDATDAKETQDNIQPKDLVIRDLGYFSQDVYSTFINKQAFIISKLNTRTSVYELKNNKLEPIAFDSLYQWMQNNEIQQLEKQVYVGSKAKIPMRLIIDIVPDQFYNKRMREINKYNKRKGLKTTEDYTHRARFNLIITNVHAEQIPQKAILALYRIRWQIELVFKVWKSTFGIHKTSKMKYYRWLCLLYARLILIVTYWLIIMPLRVRLYKTKGKLLSFDKAFKTLKRTTVKLRNAIKNGEDDLFEYFKSTVRLISEKHWLEKKKKKIGYEQIMYLYYCKSGIYVYI